MVLKRFFFFFTLLKYTCGITVSRKTKHLAQNWEKWKSVSFSLTPHDQRNQVFQSCQSNLDFVYCCVYYFSPPLKIESVCGQNWSQQLRFGAISNIRFSSKVFSKGLFTSGLQCRIVVLIFVFHVLMRKIMKEWTSLLLLLCHPDPGCSS